MVAPNVGTASPARVIPLDFDRLWNNYMFRPLTGSFKAHMDGLEKGRQAWIKANPGKDEPPLNTPCVIQLSHALNKAGIIIPPHSFWRSSAKIDGLWYLQAVNELQTYLTQRFFPGTAVTAGTAQQRQASLNGKRGILTFGAFHCELWRDDQIRQRDNIPLPDGRVEHGMSGGIWNAPKIMFWEVQGTGDFVALPPLPPSLPGWWVVTDNNTYYYYFETDNVVFYTKTKPKNIAVAPDKTGINYGKVLPLPTSPFSVRIAWNPADGGETIEVFTDDPSESVPTMQGTSNRYGNLKAVKLQK